MFASANEVEIDVDGEEDYDHEEEYDDDEEDLFEAVEVPDRRAKYEVIFLNWRRPWILDVMVS